MLYLLNHTTERKKDPLSDLVLSLPREQLGKGHVICYFYSKAKQSRY